MHLIPTPSPGPETGLGAQEEEPWAAPDPEHLWRVTVQKRGRRDCGLGHPWMSLVAVPIYSLYQCSSRSEKFTSLRIFYLLCLSTSPSLCCLYKLSCHTSEWTVLNYIYLKVLGQLQVQPLFLLTNVEHCGYVQLYFFNNFQKTIMSHMWCPLFSFENNHEAA